MITFKDLLEALKKYDYPFFNRKTTLFGPLYDVFLQNIIDLAIVINGKMYKFDNVKFRDEEAVDIIMDNIPDDYLDKEIYYSFKVIHREPNMYQDESENWVYEFGYISLTITDRSIENNMFIPLEAIDFSCC